MTWHIVQNAKNTGISLTMGNMNRKGDDMKLTFLGPLKIFLLLSLAVSWALTWGFLIVSEGMRTSGISRGSVKPQTNISHVSAKCSKRKISSLNCWQVQLISNGHVTRVIDKYLKLYKKKGKITDEYVKKKCVNVHVWI